MAAMCDFDSIPLRVKNWPLPHSGSAKPVPRHRTEAQVSQSLRPLVKGLRRGQRSYLPYFKTHSGYGITGGV